MPIGPSGAAGGGGGLSQLYASTLAAPAASIDTGAGGISTLLSVLDIYLYVATSQAVEFSTVTVRFNNDSGSNYIRSQVQAQNGVVTGSGSALTTQITFDAPGTSVTTSYFSSLFLTIPNYSGTTGFKLGSAMQSFFNPAAPHQLNEELAFAYASTTAISRMSVSAGSGNLITGSQLLIYGR